MVCSEDYFMHVHDMVQQNNEDVATLTKELMANRKKIQDVKAEYQILYNEALLVISLK